MTDTVNTEAEYLLRDIDFSEDNAHLAYTLGSGAASGKNEAYLFKGETLAMTNTEKEEAIILAKGMMYNDKRRKMEMALTDMYKEMYPDKDMYMFVEDFDDKEMIYMMDSKLYKMPYMMMGDKIMPMMKEVMEMRKEESYVPMYKSNSPENLESKGSDALSGSIVNKADNGVNKNKEEHMADTNEITVDVTKSAEFLELQKSMADMQELLKSEQAARESAEKEKTEIQKAAELERIEKAKTDMTEVVTVWDLEKADESLKSVDVVDALLKSESSSVLINAMEALHKRNELLKAEFGKEEGFDGEVKPSATELEKSKSSVAEILKARKEKANAAKATK